VLHQEFLFRSKFARGERFEAVAPQMKISGRWGLRSGDGSESQDANQQKSKSHLCPHFYFSFLITARTSSGILIRSFCGQSIHDAV
jgi:ribosomal protein L37AE/L43A